MFEILPKDCNLMSIHGGIFPVTIYLRERINPGIKGFVSIFQQIQCKLTATMS